MNMCEYESQRPTLSVIPEGPPILFIKDRVFHWPKARQGG